MHVVWVQVPEKHAFMIKASGDLNNFPLPLPCTFIKEITLLFCKLSSVL